ncbi:MAG: transposase [Phycisphaerae bacterium]|nr:transposase [Phycisphaerae bacterium]
MPRTARIQPGGVVFHALNRGNSRARLFFHDKDYAAFERVLAETLEHVPLRLLAYCLMPNHWHLLLWPERDGQLGRFMQRLTTTHARRWRSVRQQVGEGHVYQGTYKSFPVQDDLHLLAVCRYVERNALRAELVTRAEDWRWCSLWRRRHPGVSDDVPPLSAWPLDRPRNWVQRVNRPETEAELAAVQTSLQRGRPFGDETWQRRTAARLGLTHSFRPRGRPRLPQDAT